MSKYTTALNKYLKIAPSWLVTSVLVLNLTGDGICVYLN